MSTPGISLQNKVAVVTGGGGGIGRAIAVALAGAGASVVVGDIDADRCTETSEAIVASGGRAVGHRTDVMQASELEALIKAAITHFGTVDILVNNAGGVSARPFLQQSRRSWQRHVDINFTSMLVATSLAAEVMIEAGNGGSVINVTSIEGTRAAPNFAIYGACKAAMISFTKSMALELSEHRIRVNAIAPDHTITPGNQGNRSGPVDPSTWVVKSDDEIDAMNRLIPMLREGRAEECGSAALFLASEMASYVTGVVLPVDGGTSAAGGWVRNPSGRWTLNQGLDFG